MAKNHWILPMHSNVTSKVGLTLTGPPCIAVAVGLLRWLLRGPVDAGSWAKFGLVTETCGQIFRARPATQTTPRCLAGSFWPRRRPGPPSLKIPASITGIPVLFFSNTEIPVLPNVVGIGGPICRSVFYQWPDLSAVEWLNFPPHYTLHLV